MNRKSPLVSVIIPTYNRAAVLSRAIDSVLDQSYENIEIIIVDDESTDDTSKVVRSYNEEMITYIKLDENQGAPHARNVGIKNANGQYISFLDSDDEYLPNRISRLVEVHESEPEDCVGVFHSFTVQSASGVERTSQAPDERIGADEICKENVIGGLSCTMFERNVLIEVGLFDESLPSAQDYDLYLRVLDGYTMRGIDEFLSIYYITRDSISNDIERKIKGQEKLKKKHANRLTERLKSRQNYSRFFLYTRQGDFKQARTELGKAIYRYPWNPLYYYHYLFSLAGPTGMQASMEIKEAIKNHKLYKSY